MAVNVTCGEGDCHVQANSPQVAVPLSHASPEPCDAITGTCALTGESCTL